MDAESPDDPVKFAEAVHAAEAAALREKEAEDDEKRRIGKDAGGDLGNPADADLSANIRPDVVAAPGGLATITTAKSATYHPDEELTFREDRDEWSKAPSPEVVSEAAKPQVMTREAIFADPWNAVALPLPKAPDERLLHDARAAVDFVEMRELYLMEADVPEYGAWHESLRDEARGRRHEINAELQQAQENNYERAVDAAKVRWAEQEAAEASAEGASPLTVEALAENRWNAVYRPVPDHMVTPALDASQQLLEETRIAWNTHGLNGDAFAADDLVPRIELLKEQAQELMVAPAIETAPELAPSIKEMATPASLPEATSEMSAADYVASRVAEARADRDGTSSLAIEAEAASRHNEQQSESARPAEAGSDSPRDERLSAADYVAARVAEARADAKERGEKDNQNEIERGGELPRGQNGRDIF